MQLSNVTQSLFHRYDLFTVSSRRRALCYVKTRFFADLATSAPVRSFDADSNIMADEVEQVGVAAFKSAFVLLTACM